jgi:RNA polymerase sigma-70 factor (ECF subfamily)
LGQSFDDKAAPLEDDGSFDGDLKADRFVELLNRHDRQIYAYVYAMVVNWDDAQEIMQRLRLRLWQQFDRYDSEKPFSTWARAIAYYLVLTFRKERGRQREYFSQTIIEAVGETFEETEEAEAGRREVLLNCLQKLSAEQRDLVDVYYGRSKPIAELAGDYGVKPGALRQTLFRIRKLLRNCADRSLQGISE